MKYYNKVKPPKAPPKFDITNAPLVELNVVNKIDLTTLKGGKRG